MKLDREALERRESEALQGLMKLCAHCARIGSHKVGARMFEDDIAQDMTMLVLDRFIHEYDGERDVEPFLVEVARRMALSYQRRHSREVVLGGLPDGDRNVIEEHPDDTIDIERDIDAGVTRDRAAEARRILVERIRQRATEPGQNAEGPASDAPADWYTVKLPRPTAEKELSTAQAERKRLAGRGVVKELVRLRKGMGLTQVEMAAALGVSANTLRSIEYGAAKGNPEELVLQARSLTASQGTVTPAGGEAVAMIEGWMRRLGLHEDDTTGLAERIGVHRATLFRWRTGRTEPPGPRLRRINALVDVLVERRSGNA